MNVRPSFRFSSVARLEQESAEARAHAVLPEMANISEHGVSLSGGRRVVMRRFDSVGQSDPSPSAVVFQDAELQTSQDDVFCRYLAEALSLPVVLVRDAAHHRLSGGWLAEWWDWCCANPEDLLITPSRTALGVVGSGAGALLTAISLQEGATTPTPRGLFFVCGDFRDTDVGFFNLMTDRPNWWPPTYIATCPFDPERSHSRRMTSYLLERRIEHWYIEWPGITARCLQQIQRVPELERYMDAMVACLRGLLLTQAFNENEVST